MPPSTACACLPSLLALLRPQVQSVDLEKFGAAAVAGGFCAALAPTSQLQVDHICCQLDSRYGNLRTLGQAHGVSALPS